MTDALRPALDGMVAKLQEKLNEVADLKKAINVLCTMMEIPLLYPDVESEKASASAGPLRPDLYYGKPLSTAVREYLEHRKQALSVEDILKGLEAGGFDFDEIQWSPTNRLRNLSITLSKNTAMFKRLPNGMIGVKAWYSESLKRRNRAKGENGFKEEAQSEGELAEPAVKEIKTAKGKKKVEKKAAAEEKGPAEEAAEPVVNKATA